MAGVIGIISTINITREMKQAIKTGVNDSSVKLKFSYVGSYKENKLKKKLKKFEDNNKIKVVITLGGNKTFAAAKQHLTQKPFVSVVGVTPTGSIGQCKGGVTLNSSDGNKARVDHLVSKKKDKTKIALLCNPNSAMNQTEESAWIANGMAKETIFHAGKDNDPDDNDSATYSKAFKEINDAKLEAVVVSADPFFQETMDELVDDANESGLYVTYPLQDYNRAWEPPAPGRSTLQGPDLLDAYGKIGAAAAKVLANQPTSFVSANSSTVDI